MDDDSIFEEMSVSDDDVAESFELIEVLVSHLVNGRVQFIDGEPKVNLSSLQSLKRIINQFPSSWQVSSPKIKCLFCEALVICNVRQCLKQSNWDAVNTLLGKVDKIKISFVEDELAEIKKFCTSRRPMRALLDALVETAPKYDNGNLHLDLDTLRKLELAVEHVKKLDLELVHDIPEVLELTEQMISLRNCLNERDFAEAKIILLAVRNNRFHETCEQELLNTGDMLKRRDLMNQLKTAVEKNDEVVMKQCLVDADTLDLSGEGSSSLNDLVKEAMLLLAELGLMRDNLNSALESYDEDQLMVALQHAADLKQENTSLAQEVLQSMKKIRAVKEAVENGLTSVNQTTMKAALVAYDVLKQDPEWSPCVQLRQLCSLPPDEMLAEMIQQADEAGDVEKGMKLTLSVKDNLFKRKECSNVFRLETCALLKSPQIFGLRRAVYDPELGDNMFQHSKLRLSTSLSILNDKKNRNLAVHAFEHVKKCMKDERCDDRLTEAKILLLTGLRHESLRIEIFAQLMKQLSYNPSPESEQIGWNLLMLCLMTFPVPSEFENHVERFLRAGFKQQLLIQLHRIAWTGPTSNIPSDETIKCFL
eukprot:TRINITY_DN6186_c0_g1_i1.p1 TRINITY_DN6186_c0_g1~~TRINITY_DN6186_c0_g1_i1.p1  ORF type:complete len:592 (+),score=169.48 TRINITY_DN6186_c0_g1_i1:1317-3092(+)